MLTNLNFENARLRGAMARLAGIMVMVLLCPNLLATTWYVRPDGGNRYSANVTKGQCDGTADLSYASTGGTGSNRHCAFNDVRYLWQDGSRSDGVTFPSWGWVGNGGDIFILRGSIATGVTDRVGWGNKSASQNADGTYWGVAGDPYHSGMPPPKSGTAGAHTRILGENYASCHTQSARTQLHGGFGTLYVIDLAGASYVDVQCLDITDFSACGRLGQTNKCANNVPLDDYAGSGIHFSNTSTNLTLTDIRAHGLAAQGFTGPTGDGAVFTYIDLLGNPSSGWNADDGTTGTGSLLVQHFNISWNGCAEQYPIVDALPYSDCTDDNSGGYGDGFGTATIPSTPGWKVVFDQGVVSYNTQDGLDALHLVGNGSSMTVTDTLAYGTMGQQIKVGGSHGTVVGNTIVGNCNALRQAIPGTPPGYNMKLSDFCRAADEGVALSVSNGATLTVNNNTLYSANDTGWTIFCDTTAGACDASAKINFRTNTFVGFLNNAADGYPSGGTGDFANPIYIGASPNPFTNPGSVYSGNTTFHAKSNWRCPARGETDANCGDPHLVDETWHLYGIGNMSHSSGVGDAAAPKRVSSLQSLTESRRAAVGCLFAGVLITAAWRGSRLGPGR